VYKPGGDPVTGFSQGILKLIGEYMGFLGTGEKLPADYIYPVLVWLGRPNRKIECEFSIEFSGSLGIKGGYRKGKYALCG
jgi:hypothetical protein